MEAFQGAVDLGYRYLEIDVRKTRDDVVVVFHDAHLGRVTNGGGSITHWMWEDIRHLDAAWSFGGGQGYPRRGAGVEVPSLDELFATFPDIHVNIDLKGPRLEWAVADLIKRHRRDDRTLVGSFHDNRLARFRRVTRGRVPTSAGPARALAMWAASRVGATSRGPEVAYQVPFEHPVLRLDQKYVDAVHASGAQLHAWTVNDAVTMHRVLDLGVDGIVTDRPDVLDEVVKERSDAGG
jgi:glycerophosphoryl diester phosphodiesterase